MGKQASQVRKRKIFCFRPEIKYFDNGRKIKVYWFVDSRLTCSGSYPGVRGWA
jgi:hypothetical protein